jgi:hypothetical protein
MSRLTFVISTHFLTINPGHPQQKKKLTGSISSLFRCCRGTESNAPEVYLPLEGAQAADTGIFRLFGTVTCLYCLLSDIVYSSEINRDYDIIIMRCFIYSSLIMVAKR